MQRCGVSEVVQARRDPGEAAHVVEGSVSGDTDRVLGVVRAVEESLLADDGSDTTGRKAGSASTIGPKRVSNQYPSLASWKEAVERTQ